jgi:hypothetical protein
MQTKKMSLANIKGKLSRAEMKNIMAGSDATCDCNSKDTCASDKPYCVACNGSSTYAGVCHQWPA